MPAALFTIGHSTHASAHFIGLLKRHDVTAVCDVRSQPYSRYNPQYNHETIAGELKDNNISYVFLGRELGARSTNSNCYTDGKLQFDKLSNEPLFQQGLVRLKQGIGKYTIALMCAEKDPITCHRTILVTRQLRTEFTIKHILEDGRIESNTEAETRLLDMFMLNVQTDLVRDVSQSSEIEEAYNRQSQKIAYERKHDNKHDNQHDRQHDGQH